MRRPPNQSTWWLCCFYLHHLTCGLTDRPVDPPPSQKKILLLFPSLSPHLLALPPLTMLIYALILITANKSVAGDEVRGQKPAKRQSGRQTGVRMGWICQEQQLHKEYDLVNGCKAKRHTRWWSGGNAASMNYTQDVMWQLTKHIQVSVSTCSPGGISTLISGKHTFWVIPNLCERSHIV